MAKYQFFTQPDSRIREWTYLDMGSNTFLAEKKQLLNMGLEVTGDTIEAHSAQDASELFQSAFCAPLEDYANSNIAGGLATMMFQSFKTFIAKR